MTRRSAGAFPRGEGVELVRCVTHDLEVPADSELVIGGWVDPGELRREVAPAVGQRLGLRHARLVL